MDTWELWERNWKNAHKFFNSKGDVNTKAKLKQKWYNDFIDMFKVIEEVLDGKP